MELKRLITHFVYRIEPKPEGGFIAHASDPNVPPLEAATREELQQKIRQTIMAGLAAQFPGITLPLQDQGTKFNFHIESKPGGGFALHSADPGAPPIEGTQEQIESHFAEKIITMAEGFSPELRQALASQGAAGDVKVFVNRKAALNLDSGSQAFSLSLGKSSLPAGSLRMEVVSLKTAKPGEQAGDVNPGSMGGTLSNSPITPERSNLGSVFLFLLMVVVVAALVVFLLHHH